MAGRCERCQKLLLPGALRYVARLRLCGDTGGVLEDPQKRDREDPLSAAVAEAEGMSEQELMEGVVEEFSFVLCPACRDNLRADPAGASTSRPLKVTQ